MNSWLEQLTITLFLLLGVNALAITHAKSNDEIRRECPIEGKVYLRLSGTLKNGQLLGWIENESVFWSVYAGRVTGFIDNHSVMLTMRSHGPREYSLVGWVGTQRIDWRSFGGVFNEWVNCY